MDRSGAGERVVSCKVNHVRDNHLQILASESVPSQTAVSLEHEDALLLGEVLRCASEPGGCLIDIKVEQVLNGLMNLMTLRARLLQEASGTRATSTR